MMIDMDYRTLTDAQLDECEAQIAAVRRDRQIIEAEEALASVHETNAADALAAAERIRAEADAARERQKIEEG